MGDQSVDAHGASGWRVVQRQSDGGDDLCVDRVFDECLDHLGSTVKGRGARTIPFTVTTNTATTGRAGNVIVVDGPTGSMATNIAIHQEAGGDAPPPPPSPPTQCADGLDNDKDG